MATLAPSAGARSGPQLDNRRVAAALIDLAPIAAAGVALQLAGLMTPAMAAVLLGWSLFYFFALESGDGQTLGKRVMRLRVSSAAGGEATLRQIAVRTVLRIVDNPLIGLVVMIATGERRQRVGDLAAGTVVTEADASGSPAEPEPAAAASRATVVLPPVASAVEPPAPEPVPEPMPEPEPVVLEPVVIEPEPEPVAIEPEPEPTEPEPVLVEPEPLLGPAPDTKPLILARPAEPEPEPEPEVDVKPVETVSAIDLIMQDSEPDAPDRPA